MISVGDVFLWFFIDFPEWVLSLPLSVVISGFGIVFALAFFIRWMMFFLRR